MANSAVATILQTLGNEDLNSISDEDLEALFAAAVQCYSRRASERRLDIFPSSTGVTATDVMLTVTAMLRSVDVQLFELGIWQTFSGIRSS
jgi:hypothetical protein